MYLGMDIGGSSVRIGLFSGSRLLKLYTQEKQHPYEFLKEVVGKQKITSACIGIAGQSSKGVYTMVNRSWKLKTSEFKKILRCPVKFVNDFELQAYGLHVLKGIKSIQKGKAVSNGPKTIIGAGTGLGRATIVKKGHTLASEAGHSALPCFSKEEQELAAFIKRRKKRAAVYEDVLSGKGLVLLYDFYKKKVKVIEQASTVLEKSILVSQLRKKNPACKRIYSTFIRFYARFARDSALQTLCTGGLFLSGGIATNNTDAFGKMFKDEFLNHPMKSLLRTIPVSVVTQEHLGVLGAGWGARHG